MRDAQTAWSVIEAKSLILKVIVSILSERTTLPYTKEELLMDLKELLEILDGIENMARVEGGDKRG
ncbi:hypothetical protein ACP26L_15530 [Paenibacillus sp. S-38]|uniref:hypothetical protein n=1 Tax=Paenibacillus sp. S-38 TaxID=3416710 RepID=UPI003CF075E4